MHGKSSSPTANRYAVSAAIGSKLRSANKKIHGGHLVLMPALRGTELQWFCGHASPPADVTVPVQGYEKYTNIPDNVLPRACTPGGDGLGQHHQ
jgi:hypothetical protein